MIEIRHCDAKIGEVNATRGKEPEKNYSFHQLVDLHDKLTLVVGKSEEHQEIIRYFEDVIII